MTRELYRTRPRDVHAPSVLCFGLSSATSLRPGVTAEMIGIFTTEERANATSFSYAAGVEEVAKGHMASTRDPSGPQPAPWTSHPAEITRTPLRRAEVRCLRFLQAQDLDLYDDPRGMFRRWARKAGDIQEDNRQGMSLGKGPRSSPCLLVVPLAPEEVTG